MESSMLVQVLQLVCNLHGCNKKSLFYTSATAEECYNKAFMDGWSVFHDDVWCPECTNKHLLCKKRIFKLEQELNEARATIEQLKGAQG